jgi:hypothetical protein
MGFHPQQGMDFEGEDVDDTEIDDEDDTFSIRRTPSSIDVRGESVLELGIRADSSAFVPTRHFRSTTHYPVDAFYLIRNHARVQYPRIPLDQ